MNPKILLEHFEWNIQQLRETLNREKTPYYRDVSLQRFGFAFDQMLKNIAAFANLKDQDLKHPNQYFEFAIKLGWLQESTNHKSVIKDYEQIKLDLSGDLADSIYDRLEDYCSLFEELQRALSKVT